MKEYVLGTGAELDLNEIWEYISQDNINAADRWIGKLFDAFEALAGSPGLAHGRETGNQRRAAIDGIRRGFQAFRLLSQ